MGCNIKIHHEEPSLTTKLIPIGDGAITVRRYKPYAPPVSYQVSQDFRNRFELWSVKIY